MMPNSQPPVEIHITTPDEGTVNGQRVTRGSYRSIHDACLAFAASYARHAGGSVPAHAVDIIGPRAEFWLQVHPDGQMTPLPGGPAGPSAPTAAPAPAAPVDGRAARRKAAADRKRAPEPPFFPEVPAQPLSRGVSTPAPTPAADAVWAPAAAVPAPPPVAPPAAAVQAPPTVVEAPAAVGEAQQTVDEAPPTEVPAASPAPAPLPTLGDLLAARPPLPAGPAEQGWRATLRRVTGGAITLRPGPAELQERQAIAAVQRSLVGPKTIAVINPKGGANKTTATLLLAATFGIHRGGYTLAWDNNETRGTMGWRALQGRHTNTAVDLLRELDRFDDPRSARVGDLDNFVRGQGSAQFDVLASDEDATSAASIDADAFNALHHRLSRFYRIIVVDTGNNMRASNWAAAVAAADQLVIVSTIREDTAQSAAWVADALHDKGYRDKVAQAVTILAAPSVRPDPALTARLRDHFGRLTRVVTQVPFDPALVAGGPIQIEELSAASRAAWLKATALVADGL